MIRKYKRDKNKSLDGMKCFHYFILTYVISTEQYWKILENNISRQ